MYSHTGIQQPPQMKEVKLAKYGDYCIFLGLEAELVTTWQRSIGLYRVRDEVILASLTSHL